MSHLISIWGHSRYKLRQAEEWLEFFGLFALWGGALLLFTVNLGHLPLRDWDEATLAQVAKEISQAPLDRWQWLFPQLWGDPYFNKPPLVHDLMAVLNHFWGVNEWTARLPGAFLTASSVPLLYLLGKELFALRLSALFSSLLYLTLLPVVRHGRLAMLDGAVLCFSIGLFLCLLRSRRDLRWSLGIGLGFTLLCLTKGMMALLLLGIGVAFLAWDTPRLLSSVYFWLGIVLGSLPGLAWYGLQFFHYREVFLDSLLAQQINRVSQTVDNHQGPPWFYLLEILKYSFPWLLFFVYGLRLAWQEKHYSWAKFVLTGVSVYFLVVTLMVTKLPWYILPIYPLLALAGGAALSDIKRLPLDVRYPRFWALILGFVATVAGVLAIFLILNLFDLPQPFFLILTLGSLSLTLGMAAFLIGQRSDRFIVILFWGMYVSLLLFFSSPHWIWELNEAFPVKPVAGLIKDNLAAEVKVNMIFDYGRPSLNFYSGRRVEMISFEELEKFWQETENPYVVIEKNRLNAAPLAGVSVLGSAAPDWVLITKIERL